MIDLEDLYFDWLLTRLDSEGVSEGIAYVGGLLHNCEFKRRVGNDVNRSIDGINLRAEFLDDYDEADFEPHVTNDLMMQECSWFEMLIALSRNMDFTYEGGVKGRFIELISNMTLDPLLRHRFNQPKHMQEYDQHAVDVATSDIDHNRFDRDGHGGLFPLSKTGYPDQRRVEIWEQYAAYFKERLEGVLF